MTIAREPRRWALAVAGIFQILTAAAHTTAQLRGAPDRGEALAIDAMRSYRLPFGLAENPSLLDLFESLSYTMSITFAAMGVLVVTIAASAGAADKLLRRLAWVNVIWLTAFVALNAAHRLPPPALAGVLTLLAFLVALTFRARPAPS